ncbi:MAG: hypothetical protein IKH56_04235 [Oscillospiraceae bacterium]|nr:hypothetical protein [Oscillospiraceae bacterium]
MCDSPIETGLYYLQSRYYDPEICRFINADGYASTGQGLLGGNAFAYCENDPVKKMDKEGTFGCAVIGAIVGGLIGGISSAANGGSFWAGAAQGAVSGAIAGAVVDTVLLTGGIAAVVLTAVGIGGAMGLIAGDAVYAGMTKTKMDWKKTGAKAAVAAVLNIVSFGFSKALFDASSTFLNYMFTPTITDIPSTIIASNTGAVGAMTNAIIDGSSSQSRCQPASSASSYTGRFFLKMRGGKGLVMMRA